MIFKFLQEDKSKKLNELLQAYEDILNHDIKRLGNVKSLVTKISAKLQQIVIAIDNLDYALDSSIDSIDDEYEDLYVKDDDNEELSSQAERNSIHLTPSRGFMDKNDKDEYLKKVINEYHAQFSQLKTKLESLSIPKVELETQKFAKKKLEIQKNISKLTGILILSQEDIYKKLKPYADKYLIADELEKFKEISEQYHMNMQATQKNLKDYDKTILKKAKLDNFFRDNKSMLYGIFIAISPKPGPLINVKKPPKKSGKVAPMPSSSEPKRNNFKK
jgi:hypothetical protein